MMAWLAGLWWRSRPRCAAPGPWRLPDCGTCCRPRGHEKWTKHDPDWHADGTGYIWNATRWRWMGEPVSVEDLYDLPPDVAAVFREDTP